ncbi:acyltransferase family protein [Thermodesulfobacteriota bacterium]
MKYRREIDGLRAVAVLPVILFHAGFKTFEGGFVGVDVFFVISGYLITTIILSDMNKGKFSIITFYERRARRILPALFFVMLCCLPFAWLWLLPNHLKDFYESLIAVSTFSSNILFWQESGYFRTAAELKPLLHTWSLSVEEQYYVFFPLFLMALWKLRKRWILNALIVVTIISLIVAQWGAYNEPTATFFLLPTRVWELAIGALIAFYFLYKKEQSEFIASHKATSEVLGLLGLALICYSVFAFNKLTPFPSLYTLLPTVGTALIIIYSTSDTISGRILSTKALVGIGLISYSTYLWHLPLFVFARHRSLTEPSVTLLLLLSVLSIVLAYFSWRYIEMPFRTKHIFDRKKILNFAVLGSILFASIGFGLASNMNEPVKGEFTDGRCNIDSEDCYSLTNGKFDVALWGDSYADAFAISLGEQLNAEDISLNLYIKPSCPSIMSSLRIEDKHLSAGFSDACYEHNLNSFNKILHSRPKYVVITSAYHAYLNDQNSDGEYILVDENDRGLSPKKFIPRAMKEMVQAFNSRGITPIILTPHPKVKNFFKERKKYRFGYVSDVFADYASAKEARSVVLLDISKSNLQYEEVNGLSLFCGDEEECSIIDEGGRLLLFDGHHFSNFFAKEVAKAVYNKIIFENFQSICGEDVAASLY